jgi:hypothetical protein
MDTFDVFECFFYLCTERHVGYFEKDQEKDHFRFIDYIFPISDFVDQMLH